MTARDRSTTMRQVLAQPLIGVRVQQVPVPEPGPGQVLVRSTVVGICGSDTHALAGHHPFLDAPYVPGHEAVGVVERLGPEVIGRRVGDRVILKPNVACGRCQNCRAGRTNACPNLSWVGCDTSRAWSGAMADYFVAPADNLYAIPDHVDDATAALVECLATPVHAARIAGDLTGARVLVLGAGTIGAFCVVAALRAGASAVVVTDREPAKTERAVRLGARAGIPADSVDLPAQVAAALGGPADVVFDCVAVESSLAQGVRCLRRAGTLLVVGVPPRPAMLPLPYVQDWEIRVQGCAAYTEVDVEAALAIAAAGELPTGELVAEEYALEDVAAAFERAGRDSSGKVLLRIP